MVAVMFIDLDGFKLVNDTYGHDVGDNVLKEVANSFRDSVCKTDTVARVGGDEFMIVLTDIQDSGRCQRDYYKGTQAHREINHHKWAGDNHQCKHCNIAVSVR